MLGLVGLAAALAAAVAQPQAATALGSAAFLRPPAAPVFVASSGEHGRVRACHAQRSDPGSIERKILPVACEQPPRSNVALNAATGGLGPLLGGGR